MKRGGRETRPFSALPVERLTHAAIVHEVVDARRVPIELGIELLALAGRESAVVAAQIAIAFAFVRAQMRFVAV